MTPYKNLQTAVRTVASALCLMLLPSAAVMAQGPGGGGAGGPSDPPVSSRSSAGPSGENRWERCADEDQICRFQGDAVVRYGAQGQYVYRIVRNRVICDTQEFGDPALGLYKSCEYNFDLNQQVAGSGRAPAPAAPAVPVAPATTADGWIFCASEGKNCTFNGEARVRFGADSRYVYRNVKSSVRCSAEVFGDPAFGVEKQCQYLPLKANLPKPDAQGWEFCAKEGAQCSFGGPAEVRFGANGRYVTRRALNGAPCTVEAFGGDPAFGQAKSCHLRYLTR